MSSKDFRVGVVGVGAMGADHARRVVERVPGARLTAVSDPDKERAQEVAGTFAGVRALGDPLELIGDDEVDGVIIASPGFAHEEQVLACLDAAKPTLCEKPLTMDSVSALRLVEAERRGGRRLVQVGFMRRFDPEYAELKHLLASGELGRTLLLHHVHRNKAVPPSFRSEMIVRDSLVHEVDISRWLFGEEIISVTVVAPRASGNVPGDVLDPQVAIFEMSGGGLVTSEVFVNARLGYEVRCEAVGESGTATVGLGVGLVARRDGRWGGRIPDDFRARFSVAYDVEVQAWVDAARRGRAVGPTTWDGYAATAVCTAALESLKSGRPVAVGLQPRLD
jgi:myo-inositol 2-dehydrogenase / D-chiro-inositol 1-dehydrogenase